MIHFIIISCDNKPDNKTRCFHSRDVSNLISEQWINIVICLKWSISYPAVVVIHVEEPSLLYRRVKQAQNGCQNMDFLLWYKLLTLSWNPYILNRKKRKKGGRHSSIDSSLSQQRRIEKRKNDTRSISAILNLLDSPLKEKKSQNVIFKICHLNNTLCFNIACSGS